MQKMMKKLKGGNMANIMRGLGGGVLSNLGGGGRFPPF
jgi:hypothetical protein